MRLSFDYNAFELEDLIHRDVLDRAEDTLQFLLKYLSDGEWHDREEVISVARHVIPPGKAYRKAESRRLQKARNELKRDQGWSDEQVEEWMANPENTKRRYTSRASATQEGIVRTGQRIYVIESLNGTNRIEQKKEGDRWWVRRVPLGPILTESKTAQERREFMKEVIGFLTQHVKVERTE